MARFLGAGQVLIDWDWDQADFRQLNVINVNITYSWKVIGVPSSFLSPYLLVQLYAAQPFTIFHGINLTSRWSSNMADAEERCPLAALPFRESKNICSWPSRYIIEVNGLGCMYTYRECFECNCTQSTPEYNTLRVYWHPSGVPSVGNLGRIPYGCTYTRRKVPSISLNDVNDIHP